MQLQVRGLCNLCLALALCATLSKPPVKNNKISHYRQIVNGLLCRRPFSNQENFSGIYKKPKCVASVPRIAILNMKFRRIKPFIFLTWRRMPCLRQKVNDPGKIPLIKGTKSLILISRRPNGNAVASCN